jgi:hypothetical protein
MVDEKGSTRGMERVDKICSPVLICHPMSASARGRLAKGPTSIDQKRKIKIMSRTDGIRKRRADELDCDVVIEGRRGKL